MPPPVNPLENLIGQFVNAFEQTPQGQAISQLFCEIAKPPVNAISHLIYTVAQHTPPSSSTTVCDVLHSAFDDSFLHNIQTGQIISDLTHELHIPNAFDFHLL
jgi:hypothetical protein